MTEKVKRPPVRRRKPKPLIPERPEEWEEAEIGVPRDEDSAPIASAEKPAITQDLSRSAPHKRYKRAKNVAKSVDLLG
jgi:hypothetical protein